MNVLKFLHVSEKDDKKTNMHLLNLSYYSRKTIVCFKMI